MKDVYLSEFSYPCIAYVKARLGLDINIEEILHAKREIYSPKIELCTGDVLVWQRHSGKGMTYDFLAVRGNCVFAKKTITGVHFGVYEGQGIVSDLSCIGDKWNPIIRMMELNEHPYPVEIIRNGTLKGVRQ